MRALLAVLVAALMTVGCMSEPDQVEPSSDAATPYCVRATIAGDTDTSLGVLCFERRYVCENVRDGLIAYGARVDVIDVGECTW